MQKQFLHTFLLLLLSSSLYGQDFKRYAPLKSQGKIPEFLLTRSSEKFERERDALAQSGTRKEKNSKEDFLLKSNFTLDNLLLSGKVLFNDPIGVYLNKVKDYLLRDQPGARDSIQVFVVRSTMVNAFSTNNGIVMFHLGLLSKLENEAQLAYILCHEFQHFLQQHPITRFVEDAKRRSNMRIASFDDYEEYLMARNRYSREQELEADRIGVELFLQSDYDPAELDAVFDVMRYSYLPFAEKAFPLHTFESDHLWLPTALELDTIQAISAPEDYDDENMSHPNIQKRRAAVQGQLKEVDKDGKQYMIGEAEFMKAREISRFEIALQYLDQRSYERAIYHSWLLLEDHPDSYFLKRIIAQSLYGLVKFKNSRNFYKVHRDYEDVEGEMQQLYYLTEQLNKEELNALALNYVWQQHQNDPESPILYDMSLELMDDFFYHHGELTKLMLRDGESAIPRPKPTPEPVLESVDSLVDGDRVVSKTITSIVPEEVEEGSGMESARSEDAYFLVNAFVDLFADREFKKEYDRRQKEADESGGIWKQKGPSEKESLMGELFSGGLNSSEVKPLGLEKVIFINPLYRRYDERKPGTDFSIASEQGKFELMGYIPEIAELAGLEYEILDPGSLEADQMDRFNDLALLRNWVSEELAEEASQPMLNLYQNEVMLLSEKYGTPYFAFNATMDYTTRKHRLSVMFYTAASFIYPLAPLTLYKLFQAKNKLLYVNWVWNIETGELVLDETRYIRDKTRPATLKSMLYYSFLQMTSQP